MCCRVFQAAHPHGLTRASMPVPLFMSEKDNDLIPTKTEMFLTKDHYAFILTLQRGTKPINAEPVLAHD